MKKSLLLSLALLPMMFAGTSCSSEEVVPASGESTVTLSVTLPDGIQSRAYGDGYTAKNLTMLVLDAADQTNTPLGVFDGGATELNTTITNLTKQVNLRLAAGKTYKVVCWAASDKAPYKFNTADFSVSADYKDVLSNDENLDAFYAVQEIYVEGNTTETVKLYRPFAQLNIGTDDLAAAEAAGFKAKSITVNVPSYQSLNLLTGEVETGDPTAVKFNDNTLPQGEKFPKTGYDYLAMNYLLMSTDKQLVDVDFTVTAEGGATRNLKVNAVPVQRNYRTNIYGSLLTNSVNINVEIIPGFNEPDYDRLAAMDLIVNTLNAGESVTLGEDLVIPVPSEGMMISVPKGKTATLNLNGKTISNDQDIWDYTNAIMNVRSGTLVINGNGKLDAKENDCYGINVAGGAHLIIEDGTFVGNISAVQVDSGICEIKGGVFDIKQLYNGYQYLLNCIDANYKNGTAKFIVTGGTFVGYNPASADSENPTANFVPEGYGAIRTTYQGKEAWKVVKLTEVTTAADLKAAKAGANVAVNTPILFDNTYLLGYGSGLNLFLNKGGELSMNNDSKPILNQTILVSGSKKLNIYGDGGKVVAPAYTSHSNGAAAVQVQGTGVVNIYGNVTFEGNTGSSANNAIIIHSGTANIYGGYFHSGLDKNGNASQAVFLTGTQGTCACNIYGGVFEMEKGGNQYLLINIKDEYRSKCTIKIYGGIFVGFDPGNNDAEGSGTSFLADGYKSREITYNGKKAYEVYK